MCCCVYEAAAGVQENVAHAFVVRVSNAEPAMHAYTARQALRHARAHLPTASDLLLRLCAWAIGEYGDLLDASQGLLEGSLSLTTPCPVFLATGLFSNAFEGREKTTARARELGTLCTARNELSYRVLTVADEVMA